MATIRSNAQRYVGMSAAGAYTQLILDNPDIQSISTYHYRTPPSLQQRIHIGAQEQALIDEALVLRKRTQLPFWTALLSTCVTNGKCTPGILSAAFYHGGAGEASRHTRDEVKAKVLEKLVQNDAKNVSLSSEVEVVDGQVLHLPMFDFHCAISPRNEAMADSVCSHLMPSGYILINSGDSYHACGFGLLTADQRIRALGKALLASPLIDSYYIAHQLQQCASSLRISQGGKATRGPVVVRAWIP